MKARVTVTLKSGVLDPQGKAIEGALKSLGVEGVASVRQGKVFDVELATEDAGEAEATLRTTASRACSSRAQTRRDGWAKRAQTETVGAEGPHSRSKSASLSSAQIVAQPGRIAPSQS